MILRRDSISESGSKSRCKPVFARSYIIGGMRRLALICLAMVLPVLSPLAQAEDTTQITIKVTEPDGSPIDRANVRVAFKEGRHKIKLTKIQHSWEMKTSQDGIVKIPPIEKGDILVQVTADFHQSFGKTFEILDDEKEIDVVLKDPQSQYSEIKQRTSTSKKKPAPPKKK